MHRPNFEPVILPELETDNFYPDHVGISFAFKKKIIDEGFIMQPSSIEDFEYLSTLRNNNYCIMISPYVKYFVNGNDEKSIVLQTGNRVIINNNNQKERFEIQNKKMYFILPFIFLIFLMLGLFLFNKKTLYKHKYLFAGLLFIAIVYLFSGYFSI
jgi:hypothetical protein